MGGKAFVITGQVVDRGTGRGISDLRVEAWDKGHTSDESITGAETDAQGCFRIEFSRHRLREEFRDKNPDLFFKVYRNETLVEEADDLILADQSPGRIKRIVIQVGEATGTGQPPDRPPRPSTQPAVTVHEVVGRLLDQDSGAPIPGFIVRGFDLDAGDAPKDLGWSRTNDTGSFSLLYTTSAATTTASVAVPAPAEPPRRRLRLDIRDPHTTQLQHVEVEVPVQDRSAVEVRCHGLRTVTPPSPSLAEAAAAIGPALPEGLGGFLAERGVTTVADILKAGGIAHLQGLPVPADHPVVRGLEAQASLSTITADPRLAASLLRSGYPSVRAIATAPLAQFVAGVAGIIGNAEAAAMHVQASAHAALFDNLLADHLAKQASGQASSPLLEETLPAELCRCEDCEAAVSPLAYLVSLLDFALKRLSGAGAAVDLQQLEASYHQPFGKLIASCEAVGAQVHQVRICVEALRSLRAGAPEAPGEADYRGAAYQALLAKLGTSWDELRLARGADAATRQALAERLGLGPAGVAHLDELLFDLSAGHPSEQELEGVFGLVDTTRDPLAPAVAPKLLGWRRDSLRAAWAGQDRPSPPRPSLLVIDPDLIDSRDFQNPVPGDPAYALWQARSAALSQKETGWRASVNKQPSQIDTALTDALGLGADALLALADQRAKGTDVSAQLDQAHLATAAFSRLVTLIQLLRGGSALMDAEWDEWFDILLQAWKQAQTAAWIAQEATQTITLSPDFFRIPSAPASLTDPGPAPFPIKPWRASLRARQDWQDTLQLRSDQDQGLADALQAAVDACEEATLPTLRDALLATTDPADTELAAKATWFTARFFLDAAMSGCAKTTRVAQAIETIQGLLFAARTGQAHTEAGALAIADQYLDHFDEEWRWMGSLATHRAAVFVKLYPGNLLLPSLRRADRATPLFRSIVRAVRTNRQFTPQAACEQASSYSDYFRDVCNLTVEASCLAPTRIHHGGCRDRTTAPEDRPLFYVFARSPEGTVYWSSYDPSGAAGYEQSFWEAVPGLGPAIRVIGAVPYTPLPALHRVLVFVKTLEKGQPKLQMVSYDLLSQRWVGDPIDLDLPHQGAGDFEAAAAQRPVDFTFPVRLVIYQRAPQGTKIDDVDVSGQGLLYTRLVNADATDWESSDARLVLAGPGIKSVNALVSYDSNIVGVAGDWVFFETSTDIRVGFFHKSDEGLIQELNLISSVGSGEWIGDIAFPFAGVIFAFVRQPDGTVAYDNIKRAGVGPIGQGPISLTLAGPPEIGHLATHSGWDSSVPGPIDDMQSTFVAYQHPQAGPFRAVYSLAPDHAGLADEEPLSLWAIPGPFDITEQLSESDRKARAASIQTDFQWSANNPASHLVYLKEAYYFLPMLLAIELQQAGEYTAALDWIRTVYDYTAPEGSRVVYPGLDAPAHGEHLSLAPDWLLDPLNPHAIAETRKGSYLEYTLLTLVGCLLDFADAEFSRDTPESLPRARELYLTALSLLDAAGLDQRLSDRCPIVGTLQVGVPAEWVPVVDDLEQDLARSTYIATSRALTDRVASILRGTDPWPDRVAAARAVIGEAASTAPPPATIATLLEAAPRRSAQADLAILALPGAVATVGRLNATVGAEVLGAVSAVTGIDQQRLVAERTPVPWLASPTAGHAAQPDNGSAQPSVVDVVGSYPLTVSPQTLSANAATRSMVETQPVTAFWRFQHPTKYQYVPGISRDFCVPPNPIPAALRLRAELNLFKLRHCQNIAGMQRELDPYAAATDATTGLPTLSGGQIVLPGTSGVRPTAYRFPSLLERAKQLVAHAQQLEAALLAALEKRDLEAYNLLKARQDVGLARAGVRLEELKGVEAQASIVLAQLQKTRAQDTVDHWNKLLNNDTIRGLEIASMAAMGASISFSIWAAVTGGQSALAQAFSTTASLLSAIASYELQQDEWQFNKLIAQDDVAIADQQIRIASQQARVVGQEQKIAQLRADQADDTVSFLANKFTNVELYEWMSGILQDVYRYLLKEATAISRLAANQLAFERQQPPPPFIQDDYWQAPSDGAEAGSDGSRPDRKGLTGSARLLQDLTQLEEYALDTNKRKLQLTETLSLARMSPIEFQRFRESGVMRFSVPLSHFDRLRPGDYLRTIRQVRVSLVALVPPAMALHATLASSGSSHVTIGGDIFQTITLRRDPEEVALSSPQNATGLFPLDPQAELLLPFEGLGVDTTFELRMPKAANLFDYQTIAEVLVTVDYTALSSANYRQQVLQTSAFTRPLSAPRPFSFRNQFPDQWFDLHHPEQASQPMTVKFTIRPEDFPPNLERLKIRQVALYVARPTDAAFEVAVTGLRFTGTDGTVANGGPATSSGGLISTLAGNAGDWGNAFIGLSPFGQWELTLQDTPELRQHFQDEEITEVLFVPTYQGHTPDWPA